MKLLPRNVVACLLLAGGCVAFHRLPRREMPVTRLPVLVIQAQARGVPVGVMERQVTSRLEGAARQVRDVAGVRARTAQRNGMATSHVEATVGGTRNPAVVRAELRERLAAISPELPHGVSTPTIAGDRADIDRPVVRLVLSGGGDPEALQAVAASVVVPGLQMLEQIANIDFERLAPPTIDVGLDQRAAFADLTTVDIQRTIIDATATADVGTVVDRGNSNAVMIVGGESVGDILSGAIELEATGTVVRLADVATVSVGMRPPESLIRVDGRAAIKIAAVGVPGSSAEKLARRVDDAIRMLSHRLPRDMRLTSFPSDDASARESVSLQRRLATGIALALVVLRIGTGCWSASIAAAAIAVLGASVMLIVMLVAGSSLTLLVLPALVTANAILLSGTWTGGRIRGRGATASRGIQYSTGTSSWRVAPGAMTLVLAGVAMLVPLWYADPATRLRFGSIAWMIVGGVTTGVICQLAFQPVIDAAIVAARGTRPSGRKATRHLVRPRAACRAYRRCMEFTTCHAHSTTLVHAALMIILIIEATRPQPQDAMSRSNGAAPSRINVDLRIEDGDPVGSVDSIARLFESRMLASRDLRQVVTVVESQQATVTGWLHEGRRSIQPAPAIQEELEALAAEHGGIDIAIRGPDIGAGLGAHGPGRFRVALRSMDRPELEQAVAAITQRLARIPRVRDVRVGGEGSASARHIAMEAVIRIHPAAAAQAGTSARAISRWISSLTATNATPVRLSLSDELFDLSIHEGATKEHPSLSSLLDARMPVAGRGATAIRDVAGIEVRATPSAIVRHDGEYTESVRYDVSGPIEVAREIHAGVIRDFALPEGVFIDDHTGMAEETVATRLPAAAVALIVALLAISTAAVLEALRRALVALATVGFSLSAAAVALRWCEIPWSGDVAAGMIAACCAALGIAVGMLADHPAATGPGHFRLSHARRAVTATFATTALLLPALVRPAFGTIVWDGAWLMLLVGSAAALVSSILFAPAALVLISGVSSPAPRPRPSASSSGTCTPAPAAWPSP